MNYKSNFHYAVSPVAAWGHTHTHGHTRSGASEPTWSNALAQIRKHSLTFREKSSLNTVSFRNKHQVSMSLSQKISTFGFWHFPAGSTNIWGINPFTQWPYATAVRQQDENRMKDGQSTASSDVHVKPGCEDQILTSISLASDFLRLNEQ